MNLNEKPLNTIYNTTITVVIEVFLFLYTYCEFCVENHMV